MNWMFKNIIEMVANLINGTLDFFGEGITSIFDMVADTNASQSMVVNASNYTLIFSCAFVTMMALKKYFEVYVLEVDGDPDSDPLDIFTRVAQAVAIMSCNDWIFTILMKISKAFTIDLTASAKVESVNEHVISLVLEGMTNLTMKSAIFIIVIFMLVIGLIIFLFEAGIRGAELSLSKILLPIVAIDLIDSSHEKWNQFFTQYLIIFVGYSIQMLCFRMFCSSFLLVNVGSITIDIIVTYGWFVVMLRAPKWLEKFCYSSGISKSIGGAIRLLPSLIPHK